MKISIITVFPELYTAFLNTSLVARAKDAGLVSFSVTAFSSVCDPKERIDEATCGPSAGMILKPVVVERAIAAVEAEHGPGFRIFFSPQGKKLSQRLLHELYDELHHVHNQFDESQSSNADINAHIILVCARYEGIDARVEEECADLLLSIGDYVLMGGDLAAQVFLESYMRLIPEVIGRVQSVEEDSFSGPFLDYPEYGLPVEWHEKKVPDIILSGNHGAIKQYRTSRAARRTILQRFDWFRSSGMTKDEMLSAKEHIPAHYVVLMHDQVYVKEDEVGVTSITSIDLHDIARSSATYGVSGFFAVSSLKDQHMIMQTFIDFWSSPRGKKYNPSRYRAMALLKPAFSFDEVRECIRAIEGKDPLIVATSAKTSEQAPLIDYAAQGTVWKHDRPVLLVFGTGRGLSDALLAQCDYLLAPVLGMTDYNHLSVRSAVAIILDRWLGLNQSLPGLLLENRRK